MPKEEENEARASRSDEAKASEPASDATEATWSGVCWSSVELRSM